MTTCFQFFNHFKSFFRITPPYFVAIFLETEIEIIILLSTFMLDVKLYPIFLAQ